MEPKMSPTVKIRNFGVVVPESSVLSLRVEIEPADTMFRVNVVVPYVVVTSWCLVRKASWGCCLTSYLTTCHTIAPSPVGAECSKRWPSKGSKDQNGQYSELHPIQFFVVIVV